MAIPTEPLGIPRPAPLIEGMQDLAAGRISQERSRSLCGQAIGVHTCPGGDKDSTHSADVEYEELLPALFSGSPSAASTSTSSAAGGSARHPLRPGSRGERR